MPRSPSFRRLADLGVPFSAKAGVGNFGGGILLDLPVAED